MTDLSGNARVAAQRIADALCDLAVWSTDGRSCNWVGRSPVASDATLRTLGADLYAGLGGIALFLAASHNAFDLARYRETCIGALRAAHMQAESTPSGPSDLSLFEGRLGLHFITGQICRMLRIPVFPSALETMSRNLADVIPRPHPLDVIAGNAGAICALLSYEPCEFRPYFLPHAVRLGEELLSRAEVIGGGLAWRPTDPAGRIPMQAPLCGLAHGASGFAVALLRLFDKTRRMEFLAAARAAFAYEQQVFNPSLATWPDLRTPDGHDAAIAPRAFDAWCHGAGGIALARIEAARLDPELRQEHLAVVARAIEITLDELIRQLSMGVCEECLCHGIAGMSEICRIGGMALDSPAALVAAGRGAAVLTNRILSFGALHDWPEDFVSKPGLMLGYSGVGYFLLGASGAVLPPVLTLFENAI
jgi:lantibiotic modifying enzyme